MIDLALSGVLGLALLVPFALAVALVRRYPLAGIGLAALVVTALWEVPNPPPLITVEGLNIGPADVITLTLFVVGVLEFPQLSANLQGWLIPWLLFGVLIAISLLRGTAAFGLGAATNEARGVMWVYFAMTWALAIRPERLRLRQVSLVLGWALVFVGLYHAVTYGIGGPTSIVSMGDGSYRSSRILVAGQAAVLLLCAGTVFLGAPRSGKGRQRGSSLVFVGVILLSQHRSVWIAGALGITAVIISARRGRPGSRAFILFAVVVWSAFAAWTIRNVNPELIESVSDAGTLEWRTSSWQALISEATARGPLSVATGEPFGTGLLRKVSAGVLTGVQAHNWYVEVFLRLGLIGLMVIASMLIAAAWKSRARSPEWMFVVVAVGVYAFAYGVAWFLAPWLAAAIVVSLRGGVAHATSEPLLSGQRSAVWACASTAPGSIRP